MLTPRCLVALALLFASASSACGDDETGTSSGGGSATSATTSTATAGTTTASGPTSGAGGDGPSAGGGSAQGTGAGSSGQGGSGDGGGSSIGGDRPVGVFVPSGYDPGSPAPLVVFLHGFAPAADVPEYYEGYLNIEALAEELGFLFAMPQGTVDSGGSEFWNATPACCDYDGTGVDDSAYLRSVVDDIEATWNVDPKRVHFMGHSNGGFMSYRMACDHADAVASIASMAGATFAEEQDCAPTEAVSILQIHGTLDEAISYEGGEQLNGTYPGAIEDGEIWAAYDGCAAAPTEGPSRDLSVNVEGDETSVLMWTDGCDPGGGAEVWTIEGEYHQPAVTETFSRQAITWLLEHPKP